MVRSLTRLDSRLMDWYSCTGSPAIVKWKDQWNKDLWPHRTAHCRSGATKQQGGVLGNARRTIDPTDGGIDPTNRPHVGSGDRSAGTGGADGSGRELVVVNRKTFGGILVSLSLSPRFSSPSGTDEIDEKDRRDQTDERCVSCDPRRGRGLRRGPDAREP